MTQRRTLLNRAIRLHRGLGLIAALTLLCFAGSGLIHPIMSRTQPQSQSFAPLPLQLPDVAMTLSQALTTSAIDTFEDATLVPVGERAAYRIALTNGEVRYLDTATGLAMADAEARHAEQLARHFSGEQHAAAVDVQPVTQFDADYLAVNRLLPVWRIRFERDDGLTAYVDTEGQRLATLVDNRKRTLQGVFLALHTFNYLEQQPQLRQVLMVGLLIISATTAAAGLIMFVKLRRADQRLKRRPQRRWHRRLALPVSLTLFSFALSGGWHLLQKTQRTTPALPPTPLFQRAELGNAMVAASFVLVRSDSGPCYRIALPPARNHAEHHHHHGDTKQEESDIARCLDTHSGAPITNAEQQLAEQLARGYSTSTNAVSEIAPVTQFGGEYGFINKRLPVWRVTFVDDPTRWYVETSSGALALRADNSDALEGWSFAYLHKWSFLGEHKDLRDALLALFALFHIAMALLGIKLWLQGRRPRAAALSPALD